MHRKTEILGVRFTQRDKQDLEHLAESEGESTAFIVRQIIRERLRELRETGVIPNMIEEGLAVQTNQQASSTIRGPMLLDAGQNR